MPETPVVVAPTVTAPVTPAAVEAPAPAPAPAAPAPKVSAREFDRTMSPASSRPEPAAPAAPAPAPAAPVPVGKIDDQGRPHAAPGTEKAGQFLPGKTEPAAAAPSGTSAEPQAAPPEGTSAAPASDPATPAVPDGHVRIEIPEALQRNFGREQIVPKEQEEFFRFTLKNHVRNAEVETAKRELKETRAQLETERAQRVRLEAVPAANEKFRQSPEGQGFAEEVRQMRQAEEDGYLPKGTTERYEKAVVDPARLKFQDAEATTRIAAERQQQSAQDGKAWMAESWPRTLGELSPEVVQNVPNLQQLWAREVRAFNVLLQDPEFLPEVTTNEAAHLAFGERFRTTLMADPKVKALYQAHRVEQEKARIAAEANATAERARLEREAEGKRRTDAEAAARNLATNPLGNVASEQVLRSSGSDPKPLNARAFDREMSRR